MMGRTGGGYLKSGRMTPDLPQAQPMKPMPQQAPQPSQAPPQAPQGVPQAPAPAAPPPQAQGGYLPGPQGAQGAPGGGEAPGQATNDVADNALMILHDEQAGPAFDKLIGQGPEGAGQAMAELYAQVRQGYESQGQPIDEDMAGEAIEVVLGDIFEIGKGMGSLTSSDDFRTMMQSGFSKIAQQFPDVAADMAAMAQEEGGAPQGAPGQPMPQGA